MKIAHVASEFSPWLQVGDLGDIVGGLVRALAQHGHEVAVFLPGYRQILSDPRAARAETVFKHTLELGQALVTAETLRVEAGKNVTLYLVRRDESFDRTHPYGPPGGEYEDSDTRFLIFCKAVADALCRMDGPLDVLHCHDWPSALAPLYVRLEERKRSVVAVAHTVFSIYQTAFQGVFPRHAFAQTNLPDEFFATDGLEFYGQVNYLKGGILFSDALLAPSPSAARELMGQDYGFGLEGVIARRCDDLRGLLTGIEMSRGSHRTEVNAKIRARDELRKMTAGAEIGEGRAVVAAQIPLSAALGLGDPNEILPALDNEALLFVLGRAGAPTPDTWQRLAQARPNQVFLLENATAETTRQILQAADFFLGTTRVEPSPLPAQRAMHHGAIPVMADTGGPADVVVDLMQSPERGTSLLFKPTLEGWCDGLKQALALQRDAGALAKVRDRALAVDSSWHTMVPAYVEFYLGLA